MTVNKLELTEQAVESIPNGAVIGLGGLSMNSAPMAIVREIIRQKNVTSPSSGSLLACQLTGLLPEVVFQR